MPLCEGPLPDGQGGACQPNILVDPVATGEEAVAYAATQPPSLPTPGWLLKQQSAGDTEASPALAAAVLGTDSVAGRGRALAVAPRVSQQVVAIEVHDLVPGHHEVPLVDAGEVNVRYGRLWCGRG
jgi:hypothetical protein